MKEQRSAGLEPGWTCKKVSDILVSLEAAGEAIGMYSVGYAGRSH